MNREGLRTKAGFFLVACFLCVPSCLFGQSPKRLVDADISWALDNARLSMLFQGKTAEECRLWQKKFKAMLEELLGDSIPPKSWKVMGEEVGQLEDHVRHHLLLEAEDIPAVPVYLLIPKSLPEGEKVPGILCVHGHGEFGYDPIVGRSDLPGVEKAIQKSHYD